MAKRYNHTKSECLKCSQRGKGSDYCWWHDKTIEYMEKEDGNTRPWRDCDYNIKEE